MKLTRPNINRSRPSLKLIPLFKSGEQQAKNIGERISMFSHLDIDVG